MKQDALGFHIRHAAKRLASNNGSLQTTRTQHVGRHANSIKKHNSTQNLTYPFRRIGMAVLGSMLGTAPKQIKPRPKNVSF